MINTSGTQPVGYKALVKPDKIEEKTAGGIILPDDNRDREGWAQVACTLVAFGDAAFDSNSEEWEFSPAERKALQPGARVYVSKYQGFHILGEDGDDYRLINDKDIVAVLSGAPSKTVLQGRTKGGLAAA